MLDIQFIRDNRDLVREKSQQKNVEVDIDHLLGLDDTRRSLITKVETLRQQRNSLSAQSEGNKPTDDQITEGRRLKEEISSLESELQTVDRDFRSSMLQVPNPIQDDVPVGADESANEVIKTVGEVPKFEFEIKDHLELGENLGIIDVERGVKVSGSRFYYLKGSAVQLEFALVNWLIAKYLAKGFTLVSVPQLVKRELMEGTGFFPADENEIYKVNEDDDELYLIGTSEVPLAGLHAGEVLDSLDEPKRYLGFSTCFRREAGSYGKDTRGVFRVHQFDKLEMYSYCRPEVSRDEHEYLLGIEEEILQDLKLPYHVLNLCSGDLGAPAAKKYDCEAWIPSQARYRELTSCSNTTDFQARRLNIRYRTSDGKTELAHTLNGTAMAYSRMLIAIMENYQQADGRVKVPEVLLPFMSGKEYL